MSSNRLSTGDKKRVSSGTGADNTETIKVICRFRPGRAPAQKRQSLGSSDKPHDKPEAFKLDFEKCEVELVSEYSDSKLFTFDKVFGAQSTQTEIFSEVSGVVAQVMAGFNGCVMAYGQTSAGKSFTMEGPSIWDKDYMGVIPRCIDGLFNEIANSDSAMQFQVTISFYEVYCEKVRDLLNPTLTNLKVRETKNEGFIVQDVTEIACADKESVLRVFELGKTNRASAPTLMNAESSRSHSIVNIVVDQKNQTTGRTKKGSLFLVDLAGSEKVSKTGASGARLEEAKNINSSLTTLGMVINALCDGSTHVPYRDSKLTMILMEALGGNSKTTLIINCNPEHSHAPESLSTLRFGERAKRIKNHAKVNENYSVDELKVMLANARKEIVKLKKRIMQLTSGAEVFTEEELAATAEQAAAPERTLHHVTSASQIVPTNELSPESDAMQTFDGLIPLISSNNTSGVINASDGTRSTSVANLTEAQNGQTSEAVKALVAKHEEEMASLNSKIQSLEEELELERLRAKDEHETMLWNSSQAEAMKLTITELEQKLLKAMMESKHNSGAMSRAPSMMVSKPRRNSDQEEDNSPSSPRSASKQQLASNASMYNSKAVEGTFMSIEVPSATPKKPAVSFYQQPAQSAPPSSSAAAALSAASDDLDDIAPLTSESETSSALKKKRGVSFREESSVHIDEDFQSSAAAAQSLVDYGMAYEGQQQQDTTQTDENLEEDTSMLKLVLQGQLIRNTLESEIKALNNRMNLHQTDTKSAEDSARTYAEKYMKLREEYESHVQKLMFKLTQEQQTRAHIEERLTDVSRRLATPHGLEEHHKNKGFFHSIGNAMAAAFGGSQPSGVRRNSISGSHHHAPSDREANMASALELAQFRVSQLTAEIEMNREAQMIVLETKESVMRSLAKQNSQLMVEKDTLSKRVEDLSLTVDQLTNLLRSVQSRKITAPTPTPRIPVLIRGGSMYQSNFDLDDISERPPGPNPKFNFGNLSKYGTLLSSDNNMKV